MSQVAVPLVSAAARSVDIRAHANPRVAGIIGTIFVMTVLVYLPAIRGGFLWDDDGHVTKPELQSPAGLARIWFELGATQQYYPLLHSAFWLEHRLWGDSVVGYHLVNVLLHATAASLVYLVLLKLGVPGAALAAAIFAVHPIEVESVAWISEQKNTLSAVFYLGAMSAYLKYRGRKEEGKEGRAEDSGWHTVALVLFVLGVLTKSVTATMPVALLVIFWWQRGRLSWREDVLPLVPFFALGAAAGGITALVERKLIGAEGAAFDLSICDRVLIAGRAIWFYLGKLVWPTNLIFIYPRWHVGADVWWQWMFPLAAAMVTAALWAVRERWRAPLAGWLFFVATLFPALGFLNVYPFVFSFVADHFQYLAGLGVIVPVAAAVTLFIDHLPAGAARIGQLACGALVILLATLSMLQSSMYGNVITLYQTTLARNPECWMACNNLGAYLTDHNRREEAEPYLREALRLRPEYPEALVNLGTHLERRGEQDAAIEFYRRALALRPDYAEAEDNWGNALVSLNRPQEAIAHYQRAAHIKPDAAMPQYNLANTLRDLGDADQATTHYRAAIRLRPSFVEAHNNLGILLVKASQLPEAIAEFQTVLQLEPDYVLAEANLSRAFAAAGRTANAVTAGECAVELARTSGDTALAREINDWLNTIRAGQR